MHTVLMNNDDVLTLKAPNGNKIELSPKYDERIVSVDPHYAVVVCRSAEAAKDLARDLNVWGLKHFDRTRKTLCW